MASNRLKLNGDKTEFIWIGSKGKLRRVQPNPLPVSGVSVVPSVVVRNLGVYVDGELSMKDHINKPARTCFFQLRQLRTIRRSLTKEATQLLLHAFVVSRLDYCNALFTGLPFPIPWETAVDSKCCCAYLRGSKKILPCHFHNKE